MAVRNLIVALALLTASTWSAISIYRVVNSAIPILSARDVWQEIFEWSTSLPIVFAILMIAGSILFLTRGHLWSRRKVDLWTGAIAGGVIPFLLAGFLVLNYIARRGTSVLSDGTFWWGMWFLPVYFTMLPALVIGGALGAVRSWLRRTKH